MIKIVYTDDGQTKVVRGEYVDEDSLFPNIGISALNSLQKKYVKLLKPRIKFQIDAMFEKLEKSSKR